MNCDILILTVLISNLAMLAVSFPREMDRVIDSYIETIRKIYRKVRHD